MKELLKKAREGNAKAQLEVALNYIWGNNGFPVSERMARIWYKKAALNGDPEAMYNLATMCLRGEGGKLNIREGLEWLKTSSASRKMHIYCYDAPGLLGDIYRNGYFGVPIDIEEALRWEGRSVQMKAKYYAKANLDEKICQ